MRKTVLLAGIMLVCMNLLNAEPAKAQEAKQEQSAVSGNWIDVANISWYEKGEPYVISTPQELAGMAKIINTGINSFKGKKIAISNSIDLKGKNWTPIGIDHKGCAFEGTFDGQNNKILNLTIQGKGDLEDVGLFGLNLGGIINLHVTCNINYEKSKLYLHAGGIAGRNYGGLIYNSTCNSFLNVSSQIGVYAGGIVGISLESEIQKSSILNCIHRGSVTCNYARIIIIGGIAGENNGSNIADCISFADIIISRNWDNVIVGGVVGYQQELSCIYNSAHRGLIKDDANYENSYDEFMTPSIGGICGANNNSIIKNCYHVGKIEARPDAYVGGIIGEDIGGLLVDYCYWHKASAKEAFGTREGSSSYCYSFNDNGLLENMKDTFIVIDEVRKPIKTKSLLEVLNSWALEAGFEQWIIDDNPYYPVL